jgi:hypothetical protein
MVRKNSYGKKKYGQEYDPMKKLGHVPSFFVG